MRAILSFGSNCGSREEVIEQAMKLLERSGKIAVRSHLYETPALDGVSAPYVNAVAELETSMDVDALNHLCKEIECRLGRDKSKPENKEVPIDIDIVIYNDIILRVRDYNQTYFRIGFQAIT